MSETLYADKFYSMHYQGNWETGTKHIFLGETRLTSKVINLKSPNNYTFEEENTFYYHPDHLGNTNFVTDYDGNIFEHMEYTPYGEVWVEESSDILNSIKHSFNSKEMDSETGFYYYGARYLDPKTSRWISNDPIADTFLDPNGDDFSYFEGMNAYGYVSNNPIKYVDPTGMEERHFRDQSKQNNTKTSPLLEAIDIQPGYPTWSGQQRGLEKKAGQQKGVTWCNRYLFRAVEVLSRMGASITNEKGIGYTDANEMVDILEGYVTEGVALKATARAAQFYADSGNIVIAGWKNKRGSGHVALVVGDSATYDKTKGPRIFQAGASVGDMYIVDGFGSNLMSEVQYYIIFPDAFKGGE